MESLPASSNKSYSSEEGLFLWTKEENENFSGKEMLIIMNSYRRLLREGVWLGN